MLYVASTIWRMYFNHSGLANNLHQRPKRDVQNCVPSRILSWIQLKTRRKRQPFDSAFMTHGKILSMEKWPNTLNTVAISTIQRFISCSTSESRYNGTDRLNSGQQRSEKALIWSRLRTGLMPQIRPVITSLRSFTTTFGVMDSPWERQIAMLGIVNELLSLGQQN